MVGTLSLCPPYQSGYGFAFSRHDAPEVFKFVSRPPPIQRAQGMPDARCTRGLMCGSVEMVHMSIQGSGEHPTSPAQWLYGLWRDLPGGPGSLSPSPMELLPPA